MSRRRLSLDGSGAGAPTATLGPGPPLQLSGGRGYAGGPPPPPYGPPPPHGQYGGGYAGARPPPGYGMPNADPSVVGWHGAPLPLRYAAERAGPRQYGGRSAAVDMRPSDGDAFGDDVRPRWEARGRQGVTLQEDEWENIRAGLAQYEGKRPVEVEPPLLAPARVRNAVEYALRRAWYLFDSKLSNRGFQTLCMVVVAAAVIYGGGRFLFWQLGGSAESLQFEMDNNLTARAHSPAAHATRLII